MYHNTALVVVSATFAEYYEYDITIYPAIGSRNCASFKLITNYLLLESIVKLRISDIIDVVVVVSLSSVEQQILNVNMQYPGCRSPLPVLLKTYVRLPVLCLGDHGGSQFEVAAGAVEAVHRCALFTLSWLMWNHVKNPSSHHHNHNRPDHYHYFDYKARTVYI